MTKKSAKKIRSIVSNIDKQIWQYPCSVDESQGDSSNTDGTHQSPTELGLDTVQNSMSIVASPQKHGAQSEQVAIQAVNTGAMQVNYSNVQIAGPPPLLKSCFAGAEHSTESSAIPSPNIQYSVSPPPLIQCSD